MKGCALAGPVVAEQAKADFFGNVSLVRLRQTVADATHRRNYFRMLLVIWQRDPLETSAGKLRAKTLHWNNHLDDELLVEPDPILY